MVQHKSVAIIRQMFQSQNTNLLLNFHHLIIWSVWIFGLASYQLLTGEILPHLCCCHFLVCMFCDGIIWSVWISALASYQLLTGEILHWKEDSLSSSGPPTPTQLFRSSSSSSWSLLSPWSSQSSSSRESFSNTIANTMVIKTSSTWSCISGKTRSRTTPTLE